MRFIFAFALVYAFSSVANAQESSVVDVRGFKFEFGLVSEKKKESLLPSLTKQVEIVERVQVPADMMTFFKTIPIIIDPKAEGSKGHAQRVLGQQIVNLQDIKLPDDKPILLHELIHGYFAVKLRGNTPIIPRTYKEAQSAKYFPKKFYDAHFMENPNEFFTVISTIYLFGEIDQPPFGCTQIAKHQPEFVAFLAKLYGPRQCN